MRTFLGKSAQRARIAFHNKQMKSEDIPQKKGKSMQLFTFEEIPKKPCILAKKSAELIPLATLNEDDRQVVRDYWEGLYSTNGKGDDKSTDEYADALSKDY